MHSLPPMPSRSGLLHSSNGLGWNGIVVEHHLHGPGEWQAPALAQHMACVNLGTPIALRQSRGERFVVIRAPQPFLFRRRRSP